jgi:dinuclear metal center YbgI/SA1388 family protein
LIPFNNLKTEFERLWPLTGAESWDTPGLQLGDPAAGISRVLLTVDVTPEIVEEAVDGGFDLILSHHPMFLRGVQFLASNTGKGAMVALLNRANVLVYSAHTNADIVAGGVSDTLAKKLGLLSCRPLTGGDGVSGHGRVGSLGQPISLLEFAQKLARLLPPTAGGVRVAGSPQQEISKVSLCAGAGDAFIAEAVEAGADVFITSDLRHHPVSDALASASSRGTAFSLIDISHWAAEWLWLEVAANQLEQRFTQVQFVVSELRTDPWDFSVTQ